MFEFQVRCEEKKKNSRPNTPKEGRSGFVEFGTLRGKTMRGEKGKKFLKGPIASSQQPMARESGRACDEHKDKERTSTISEPSDKLSDQGITPINIL